MNKAARLNAEQRDDLVAYLDGELPESETQAIDKILAQSEVARHEVEALARTWELLNLLEQPNATSDFTERTLTTLKVSELRPSLIDQPWFAVVRKTVFVAVWLAVLASCAVGGFYLTAQALPNSDAELLTKLPLLRNLDLYLQIDDMEFVNALRRQTDFATATVATPSTATGAGTRRLATSMVDNVSREVLFARQTEAARLSQIERDRILKNWDTFQQLPKARQNELIAFHRQVSEEPEAVHALLETYAVWLQTLSPGQRDDLRKASSAGSRIELVRRFKAEQEASRETQMFDLNLDVRRGLSFWWRHPHLNSAELATLMEAAKKELELYDQQRVNGQPSTVEKYLLTLQLLVDPRTNRRLNEEAVRRMIATIPNEQVSRYVQRGERIEDQRRELFRQIGVGLLAFVFEEMQQLLPSEKELQEFFVSDKIDGETRYELMQLPPHLLTPALIRRYFDQLDDPRIKRLEGVRRQLQGVLMNEGVSLFGNRPGFPPRSDGRGPRGENDGGGPPRNFDGRPGFGPGRFNDNGPPPPPPPPP